MMDVNARRNSFSRCVGLLSLVALTSLWGCGGASDDFATAKVTGKLTLAGQPVTGGEIVFIPVGEVEGKPSGKNGGATVGADGTFTVSTYVSGDGAVVGKHKLSYMPPVVEVQPGPAGSHTPAKPSPYLGMVLKPAEVTITKGENKVDLELVK